FAGNVLFVPTHDFVRKPKESPNPTHGHHEFGNAETYFLAGDALGKGMVKLLTPQPKDKPAPSKENEEEQEQEQEQKEKKPEPAKPTSHTSKTVEGWTVRVDDRLLKAPDDEL